MRRGWLALLVIFSLLAGTGIRSGFAAPVEMGGHLVQPAADLLRKLGIVRGDPGGEMRLDEPITRAELVRIAIAALGQDAAAGKAVEAAPPFADVAGHWARGFIALAHQKKIASGYSDGTFRPQQPVTYAEALTILLRASGLQPTGPWPQAYMEAARKGGVLDAGLEKVLPPHGPALRSGVFLLAARSFTRLEDGTGKSLLQRTLGTEALVSADRAVNGSVAGYFVQPAVDLLRRLGILSGNSSDFLRLGSAVTRAELAKIVVIAMGKGEAAKEALQGPPVFADLGGHWARGYVAVAQAEGVMGGSATTGFQPEQSVTNAELLGTLLRASGMRVAAESHDAYVEAALRTGVLTEQLAQDFAAEALARRAVVFLLAERSLTRLFDQNGQNLLQRAFGVTAFSLRVEAQGVKNGETAADSVVIAVTAPGAVMVRVNGRQASLGNGHFYLKVALQSGANEIAVLALDELGREAAQRLVLQRR